MGEEKEDIFTIEDDISRKILSDITIFNKYSKYIPDLGRREN